MNLFMEAPDRSTARRQGARGGEDAWVKSMQAQYLAENQGHEDTSSTGALFEASEVDAARRSLFDESDVSRTDYAAPDQVERGLNRHGRVEQRSRAFDEGERVGHNERTERGQDAGDTQTNERGRHAAKTRGGKGRHAERPQHAECAQSPERAPHPDGPYSVAQESYREELAFHKQRARRRRLAVVGRTLALVVLIPVALVIVFVGSYVMTCIINGATPDEVFELLQTMPMRVSSFVRTMTAGAV